jgi:elongation factor Ts
MAITAVLVKELRERTGAGMMECKKALVETDGDIEASVEHMRKSGLAKADKKSDRVAAEGVIVIDISDDGKKAAMVEVNSETDFVSKGDDFKGFSAAVAKSILEGSPADIDALIGMPLQGGTGESVNDARQALVSKIGENIQVRRFIGLSTDNQFGAYLHGVRIGVLVELKGGDEALAKDIAMHVAASRPACVSEKEVSKELLAKEKDIFVAQAKESGKPDNIIEKMVEGRLRKYLAEITLVGQPFVKNPDTTVGELLEDNGAEVICFHRLEVGEGIEKKNENFADEVMAQVNA